MLLFIILMMSVLAGTEIDLIVPSFPNLQEEFVLTPYMVELTLGVNLVAHGLSALIIGALGDKYGKRSIILYSIVIFIIGTIICIFAHQYYYILIGRVLQGVGISGPAILPFIIIADLYELKTQQKIMSILNGLITLAMAFAPTVGSYINFYYGWKGNFILLLILALISLYFGILYLPKTDKDHTVDISIKGYLAVFKSQNATLYIFCICFLVVGYWVFIALSPILYMGSLGVNIRDFGVYQGVMAFVFAITSLGHYKIISVLGEKRSFMIGIGLFIVFIIASIIVIVLDIKKPWIITFVVSIYSLGMTPIVNILYPIMLSSSKTGKARLGASITTFKLLIFFANVQIVSYIYIDSYMYIGLSICVNLVIALFLLSKLFKNKAILIS
ncbi:Inner membrane transport protein ydhC [Rickettsiales bacterium Ac37b]|nr:Inner membrane transport protein ydhC [Rickettsiales bacterium Ac37b]